MKTGGIAGFTLLELLVVLTILALLTLAIPTLFSSGAGELQAAAQGLADDLRAVREEAIRQREPRALALQEDHYSLVGIDRQLASTITVTIQPGAANLFGQAPTRITFFADGSSSGGTIVLRRGAAHLAVEVIPLDGKVMIDD
jgi:general secretion pathway protein H